MRLQPVGEIKDLASLDFEPLIVPIIGYNAKKEAVVTDIRFVGQVPAGAAIDMIRNADAEGNVDFNGILAYVDGCVLEQDREKWDDLLHGTKVIVVRQTLVDVYKAIAEFYTKRPIRQRSASSTGRSSTKPTSRAAASASKSTRTA